MLINQRDQTLLDQIERVVDEVLEIHLAPVGRQDLLDHINIRLDDRDQFLDLRIDLGRAKIADQRQSIFLRRQSEFFAERRVSRDVQLELQILGIEMVLAFADILQRLAADNLRQGHIAILEDGFDFLLAGDQRGRFSRLRIVRPEGADEAIGLSLIFDTRFTFSGGQFSEADIIVLVSTEDDVVAVCSLTSKEADMAAHALGAFVAGVNDDRTDLVQTVTVFAQTGRAAPDLLGILPDLTGFPPLLHLHAVGQEAVSGEIEGPGTARRAQTGLLQAPVDECSAPRRFIGLTSGQIDRIRRVQIFDDAIVRDLVAIDGSDAELGQSEFIPLGQTRGDQAQL